MRPSRKAGPSRRTSSGSSDRRATTASTTSSPTPSSTFSVAYQNKHGQTSSRRLVATTGVTRYPSTCPAPCPAGQIILPTNIFGQASMDIPLLDSDVVYTERINQLDLKLAKTFRYGRVSVTPSLEAYNLMNTDSIVSYVTTNALNAAYLRPNSIVQGRFYGFGFITRW